MKLFNKIAVIGIGLIGGSIALIAKNKKLAGQIVGISRHKKNLQLAVKRNVIDEGSQELDIIKGADLVIFATPVNIILNLAPLVSKIIGKDCIISDVGSTKGEIVMKLEKIFTHYVGAHPLAGSEKQSVVNASSDMFVNSLCIFTPTKKTDPRDLRKMKKMWNFLGARVTCLPVQAHDKIMSYVSHLPHVVAYSLIECIPKNFFELAPNSLRDTTRIAASDSNLWADIFLSNSKNMINSIGSFQRSLGKIKSALSRKDREKLIGILNHSISKRSFLADLQIKKSIRL